MSEPTPPRSGRRRRRRPARAQQPPPAAEAAESVESVPAPAPASKAPAAQAAPAPGAKAAAAPRKRRPSRDAGTERGLRDLVGAGRSQLGVSGALRGRDVNRPTEEDIAEAERSVTVVRRNWHPPS